MIDLRNTGKLMILTNILYHSLLLKRDKELKGNSFGAKALVVLVLYYFARFEMHF